MFDCPEEPQPPLGLSGLACLRALIFRSLQAEILVTTLEIRITQLGTYCTKRNNTIVSAVVVFRRKYISIIQNMKICEEKATSGSTYTQFQ